MIDKLNHILLQLSFVADDYFIDTFLKKRFEWDSDFIFWFQNKRGDKLNDISLKKKFSFIKGACFSDYKKFAWFYQ